MSEKRRDKKGRILHNGEMQMPDGRYRYKYCDIDGKEKAVYSWKLVQNDIMPIDKRKGSSLREKEKEIQAKLFGRVAVNGGEIRVPANIVEFIVENNDLIPEQCGRKKSSNVVSPFTFDQS